MDADIKGALEAIETSFRSFEHKGKRMTKKQVRVVLEYGVWKGYKLVSQIPDVSIDKLIEENQ